MILSAFFIIFVFMEARKLIDNIRNIAANFIPSDDARLHPKQVLYWINYYRAKSMLVVTDYGKSINPFYYQDMGIVPVTKVDKAECSAYTVGCSVYKVEDVPDILDFPYLRGINVQLPDKQSVVTKVEKPQDIEFKTKSRFCCDANFFYMVGNTIYIESPHSLKWINIRGVFAEPEEVEKFCDTNSTKPCKGAYEWDYPVPKDRIDEIVANILSRELNISYQFPNDNENDGDEPGQ